jgi:hypothetical protein
MVATPSTYPIVAVSQMGVQTQAGSNPARTITYAKPAIGALRGGRVREVVMKCLMDCDSDRGIAREGNRVMPS